MQRLFIITLVEGMHISDVLSCGCHWFSFGSVARYYDRGQMGLNYFILLCLMDVSFGL